MNGLKAVPSKEFAFFCSLLSQALKQTIWSRAGWWLHYDPVHFERRRALDAHHGDLAETLFEAGWTEAFCHLAHDVIADGPLPAAVPLHAHFQRNIEEDCLRLITKALGHLDPLPALVGREIGRVHVIPWHFRDQAGAE